ncbi:MAG TPA: glycosyltransferase [Anaerolineales bacterium]|nr:glycosyltransferase [Anaerolineales bacterium]
MSLVSVIVPAYNQDRYLAAAVESALAQTHAELEVIIVDDGSTDQTAAIAHGFTDRRVRILSQDNRGLPAARNAGIDGSWGRFITFLDADDLFLPNKISLLLDALQMSPEGGLAAGQAIPIDEAGQPAGTLFDRGLPEDGADLLLGNPLHVGSVLLRRSWLETVGGFDESLHSYEDWDLWLRLARAGCPMRWIAQPVSLYRFHSRQMTRDGNQMTQANLAVLEKIFTDPDLPEVWTRRRDAAYSNAYLRAAANSYLAREFAAAKGFLSQAVERQPGLLDNGGHALSDRFSAWADLPKAHDPIALLEDIYANLPPGFEALARRQRHEVSKAALRLALDAHRRGDAAPTREYLWRALCREPGWIARRGVASILVRSTLLAAKPR